jgi:Sensors of blue-light using FAD
VERIEADVSFNIAGFNNYPVHFRPAMHTTDALQEILYISTISAGIPIRAVADIAARSRSTNRKLDITGLLIFDGMHFCQQLEGSCVEIEALMQQIHQDPRHTDVEVVHQGPLDQRRFRRFSLGFTSVEDVEALQRLRLLKGRASVDAFMTLLSSLDVDG